MKSAVKMKPKAQTYENWLWSLTKEERSAHFEQVKKIVASHKKPQEATR